MTGLDFNWTTIAVGILNLLVGGALVAFIRSRVPMRKVVADREANLLRERADEMVSMRHEIAELKGIMEAKERQREAERAIERHRFNNLDASFNALLLLLKKGVAVEEAVGAVEKMRAEQLERESKEKAVLQAALIDRDERS